MSETNTKFGPVVQHSIRELFEAYDNLPAAIRQALREANFNWSPIEIAQVLKDGMSKEQVIQTIKWGDQEMMRLHRH